MTAARLTAARAGARLSRIISETPPSVQRSALALFGVLLPCALVLAVAIGHALARPLLLTPAIVLSALQIAYLRYGSPGARGWGVLAVAVPLTLAVATLAMTTDGDVLFPLLFASVCWTALSLNGRQVVANVAATIAVSALPLVARWLGWEDGNPAEGLGGCRSQPSERAASGSALTAIVAATSATT